MRAVETGDGSGPKRQPNLKDGGLGSEDKLLEKWVGGGRSLLDEIAGDEPGVAKKNGVCG